MSDKGDLAVVCKGITKTYGEGSTKVEALRGVDLDVKKGELLMLMGPSGSGKTTLISIIAGILTHNTGECLVGGYNFKTMNDREKTHYRGLHIGFVFQSFNLIPTLSCEENVAIPLLINGTNRKDAFTEAKRLLTQVGIEGKSKSYPKELSGGQQQRVAIARAMIHAPDLIVCDEPTSSLDHDTGQKVMQLLRDLVTQKNKTLIVVSHDARITHFADRIVNLDDGKIVSSTNGQG